jgi:hypothetical protein
VARITDRNGVPSVAEYAVSVDPPEALFQRVMAGAFGDEGVEVGVGLDRLSADNYRWPVVGLPRPARADPRADLGEQVISVEWPHAPGDQVAVGSWIVA